VAGYYAGAELFVGAGQSPAAPTVWLTVVLIAGPVLGVAGVCWRDGRRSRGIASLALLGGIFVSEGLWYLLVIPDHPRIGWRLAAVGALVPLLLGRSKEARRYGRLALVTVALVSHSALDLAITHSGSL